MKKLINLFCFIITGYLSSYGQDKSTTLADFLSHSDLAHAGIGIQVLDANKNVVLSHNSDLNLIPASTLKILTSISALEFLSPDFQYQTILSHTSKIESDGNLTGDLIISASGDPSLCSTYINQYTLDSFCKRIYQALLQKNINCIDGRLIISLPDHIRPALEESWLWQDIANYYAGGAHPFNIIDNSYNLFFNTNKTLGVAPTLSSIAPIIPGLTVDNQLSIAESHTGDQSYIFGGPDQLNKVIKGTLPKRKKHVKVKGAIHKPAAFFLNYLQNYLSERKILVHNIGISNLNDEQSIHQILTIESPKLSSLVQIVNEKSVNLYAEAILNSTMDKTETATAQGVIEKLIEKWGLDDAGYIIKDGSGLSARNSISAGMLSNVLHEARSKNWFDVLLTSLAEGGKEGTLKNMFTTKDKGIHVYAKSGSMSKVRCYAGYVYDQNQSPYTFTILVNNYTMKEAELRRRIEKLVLGLVH